MSKHQNTLQQFISTAPEFQYSINLEYDLENTNKIEKYIAMENSLEILSDVLLSLDERSNDRARLLIGAYGKGKSHLVLVLLGILYHKDTKIFKTLLEKLRTFNNEAYQIAIKQISNNDKFLPVVITGTDLDLKQSLLKGIKDALAKEGLDDIVPDTYFDAAIRMIENWDKDYSETYKNFIGFVDGSVEEFIEELNSYDQSTYEIFQQIYPKLTSGGEFNPLNGIDIVQMYDNISDRIRGLGYHGIYIIYDEFSKFLEGSLDRNSAMEIKLLQDLAEKSNRSGKNQMHILLISHKYISNYVDMLPKEKIDAWKAVENRYKVVEMVNHKNQTYELMSEVILKAEPQWERFKEKNRTTFGKLALETSMNRIFGELGKDLEDTVIYGTYPLHPVSTFLLPRISEKIAQNERTIFTFLSTMELNTLGDFIRKQDTDFPLMTPEFIFDYFENLFKQEKDDTLIYKTWRKTKNALKKMEGKGNLKESILKTMGLMYIIQEFNNLPPGDHLLKLVYQGKYSEKEVQEALSELIKEKCIISLKSKGYYDFAKVTKGNVYEEIMDTKEKRKNQFNFKTVIGEIGQDLYIYPNRYNDDYEIVRFFDYEFVSVSELLETKNWDKKVDGKERDGVIFPVIIETDEDIVTALNTIKKIKQNRSIFIVPKKVVDLTNYLREYEAISFLMGKNQHQEQDELIHEELNLYLEDIVHQIHNELQIFTEPKLNKANYFYNGEEKTISRRSMLNHLVSVVCENIYYKTPVVVNEVINKNQPSSQAINGRKKVIEGILKNHIDPSLGISGHGVEYSIKRATLNKKEIFIEDEKTAKLKIKGIENDLQPVLDLIIGFLLKTADGSPRYFNELYETLTSADDHFGMRKGLIPIYIAAVMSIYKEHLVITKNKQEIDISSDLIERINKTPDQYQVFLEEWDTQKDQYLENLEKFFGEYILTGEKEYNHFQYVARGMQRWFLSLPKYTMESDTIYLGKGEFDKLSKEVLRLKSVLKSVNLNAREFLFDKLPRIYGYGSIDLTLTDYIYDTKRILDEIEYELTNKLEEDVFELFAVNQKDEASLTSVMKDWYQNLKEDTKTNLFNHGEERLLNEIQKISNNSTEFIGKIGKTITGLRIEDWNEEVIKKFLERVKEYKENIEAFDQKIGSDSSNEEDSYEVTFYADGLPIKKAFRKQNISGRAKMLYNEVESSMEDYGNISANEKRQILLEIFKNFC